MPQFTFGIPQMGVRPVSRRVQVQFNGVVVADSDAALLFEHKGHKPEMYVPVAHVLDDAIVPSQGEDTRYRYFDVVAQDRTAPRAAWTLRQATDELAQLEHHISFDPAQLEIVVDEDGTRFSGPDPDREAAADAEAARAALLTSATRD